MAQRTIKIDQKQLLNFLHIFVKNITDSVQSINFYDTRLTLAPRQKKLIRIEKTHYNAFRNSIRGRFHVFEHNFKQDIIIRNPLTKEKKKIDLLLEDGRPVIMFPGDELMIQGVRLLDLYASQVNRDKISMEVLPNNNEKLEINDDTYVPQQRFDSNKKPTKVSQANLTELNETVEAPAPQADAPVADTTTDAPADAIAADTDLVNEANAEASADDDDNKPSSPADEAAKKALGKKLAAARAAKKNKK